MNFINELLPNIIGIINIILIGIISYIATVIKKTYVKYADTDLKKDIVKTTVEYVEQISKKLSLNSKDKFTMAKDKAISFLNEKGINISDNEIELLIESAVNTFNQKIK